MKTINRLKVFSVTRREGRDDVGERIGEWIAANPRTEVLWARILQTSDRKFHCLTIVLACRDEPDPAPR